MAANIAVFASGGGSNALKIIEYFEERPHLGKVALLVANKANIGALSNAASHGVPSEVVTNEALRESPGQLLALLRRRHINFIALAGFLAKVPDLVTAAFAGRLVNIHPALLPLYGGKGMYGDHVHRAVLADKRTESGITIHQVNEVYDEGEVLFQKSVPVEPGETVESLRSKIQVLEHTYYPKVIAETLSTLRL